MSDITLLNDVTTESGDVLKAGTSYQWVDCDMFGHTHFIRYPNPKSLMNKSIVGIHKDNIAPKNPEQLAKDMQHMDNLLLILEQAKSDS